MILKKWKFLRRKERQTMATKRTAEAIQAEEDVHISNTSEPVNETSYTK